MAVATPSAPSEVAAARASTPRSRAPQALLAALLGVVAYAAFSDGATTLPRESWVQLALLVLSGAALVRGLYAGDLRVCAAPAAWAAAALLAGYAAWSGVSILWSVAPDRSWLELNRSLAYALILLLGLAVGSSLPRAAERAVKGFGAVVVLVALYALGAKTVPGLRIDGLIDLDHAAGLSRLREPFGYWNALGLFCVLGVPGMLSLASDPSRGARGRVAGLAGAHLLLLVVGLTYSRGALLALAVALAIFVALSRERVRAVVAFVAAGVAAGVPLAVAFSRADLTADGLPLAAREDDALLVLLAFLGAGALLLAAGRALLRLESRRSPTPARVRPVRWGSAMAGTALAGALAAGALAAGIGGDLRESFTETRRDDTTDPGRLVSASSGNRWTWWKEAAGAWSDKPVQGWGAGSFPVTHRMYRRDALDVSQPHSVPLQFLAETGLVGLALGLGALLALIAAALARARRTAGSQRGHVAALAALPVAWTVHSLVDWDWDIPGATLPVLLLGGIAAARPPGLGRPAPPAPPNGTRGPALAIAVAVLAVIAVSAALPAIARTRTQAAVEQAGDRDATPAQLRRAARDAELAASLNPLAVEPLFAAASIAERRGSLDEARRQILRALDRQPDDVSAWFRLIRIDFARRDAKSLRHATARALELDPMNPAAIVFAARAQAALTPPELSPTATGSPLPTEIPATEPAPAGALEP
jgi:hypothetical protein